MAMLSAYSLVQFVIAVCSIAEMYFEKVSLLKKGRKGPNTRCGRPPNTFKLHLPTPTQLCTETEADA